MFIDRISYKLAEGVTEDFLKESASDILDVWINKQPGFLGWSINKVGEGEYTDLVYWEDKESMEAATGAMADIPADHPWLTCYDMSSISAQKLENIFKYKK